MVHKSQDEGYEIRDSLDDEPSTTHYAVRRKSDGKLVSSIRTVCSQKSQLEMERLNWFDLPKAIKDAGAVEWCRLVADREVRGTSAVPMLYQQSVIHQQDLGTQNFVFMVET